MEEGDRCRTEGCDGIICLEKVENCSCHIAPPCSACVDAKLHCPDCGITEEDISNGVV